MSETSNIPTDEHASLDDANCIGYTLHHFGLIPQERYISPGSLSKFERYFDQVGTLEEADAIAAILDANKERTYGPDANEQLSHMAVVDKSKPGYVTERPKQGKPAREVPIEEAFARYVASPYQSDAHELVYLKVKPHSNKAPGR